MKENMKRLEVIAAIVVVALIILGGLLVLRPFISAILWAAVLCFSTWGGFAKLVEWLKGRRGLAAFIMTALISAVLVVPFVVVGVTLANNVSRIGELFKFLEFGVPEQVPQELARVPGIGPLLEKSWEDIVAHTGEASAVIKKKALASGTWFLKHAYGFAVGIAQLVLSMLVAYLFYCEGDRMLDRIKVGGRRILGESIQQHLNIVGQTIRSVVYGILGTAMAQGIMAGLGFWIAGVPSAFLLGLLTTVLSIIPVGPPLVWVPVSIWLFMNSGVGWTIFMVVWGVIGISGIDNFVKPYFIMQGTNLPFVVILFGVLGGVIAFGFIGLFLGPVLLAVGYRLLREFTEKVKKAGHVAALASTAAAEAGE